ncbi:hypothetical protein Emag_006286 [Eimeria magna]
MGGIVSSASGIDDPPRTPLRAYSSSSSSSSSSTVKLKAWPMQLIAATNPGVREKHKESHHGSSNSSTATAAAAAAAAAAGAAAARVRSLPGQGC